MDLNLKLYSTGLSAGMLNFDILADNGAVVIPATATREQLTSTEGLDISVGSAATKVTVRPQGMCETISLELGINKPSGSLPTVVTSALGTIGETTIQVNGNVTDDGDSTITERGFVYSLTANPTVANSKLVITGALGSMAGTLTGLQAGTKYYVKAYAKNGVGYAYGDEVNGTTTATSSGVVAPSVTLAAPTNIAGTTAKSGGHVSNPSSLVITKQGVCWGDAALPIIGTPGKYTEDVLVSGGSGGTFVSNITGLTLNNYYYLRAYIIVTGYATPIYSDQIRFQATNIIAATLPTIQTDAVTNIGLTGATCGGKNITDGGASITQKGLVWSEVPNPVIPSTSSKDLGTGTTAFTQTLTGLKENTRYYIRAYAVNSVGTAYGNEVIFQTAATVIPVMPTLTFDYPVPKSATTLQLNAVVTSDGGSPIIQRGFIWQLQSSVLAPNIDNVEVGGGIVNVGTGVGAFTNTPTVLSDTPYRFSAFAKNQAGLIAYSSTQAITLTSSSGMPVVQIIDANRLVTSLNVFVNCGPIGLSMLSHGVKYSLNQAGPYVETNVAVGEPYIVPNTTMTRFNATITGLLANTSYWVKAYVNNAVSDPTPQESTPVTLVTAAEAALPVLVRTDPVDPATITRTTATLKGFVLQGDPLIRRGFCWNTNPNVAPTIADSTTEMLAPPTGAYFGYPTGLTLSTTYYYRAYAQNSQSLEYGAVLSFTTAAIQAPTIDLMGEPLFIDYGVANMSAKVSDNGGSPINFCGFYIKSGLPTTFQPNGSNDSDDFFTAALPDPNGVFSAQGTGIGWTEWGFTGGEFWVTPFARSQAGKETIGTAVRCAYHAPLVIFQNDAVGGAGQIVASGTLTGVEGIDVVSERGFEFTLTSDTTWANKVYQVATVLDGLSPFTATKTGLAAGTYKVRAKIVWDGPYSASMNAYSFERIAEVS